MKVNGMNGISFRGNAQRLNLIKTAVAKKRTNDQNEFNKQRGLLLKNGLEELEQNVSITPSPRQRVEESPYRERHKSINVFR